jgi:hypothetical protein
MMKDTEDGVAAKKVVASPTAVAVFGIAADEGWGRVSNDLAESVEDLRSQLEGDAEEE